MLSFGDSFSTCIETEPNIYLILESLLLCMPGLENWD
jgi:hypothetical protein